MDKRAKTVDAAMDDDRELAAVVALAGLPNQSPQRLWSLLELGRPTSTWRRVVVGRAPRTGRGRDAAEGWARWAIGIDPDHELARHRSQGVSVMVYGAPGYPPSLLDDADPPAVMFGQMSRQLDDRVRVAIVGTRKCTPYGRAIAQELGAALAGRGVDVVSGLAHGVDAAAHAGATTTDPARMVAVVAGGLDIVYPRGNAALWREVADCGALLSEWPLGAKPTRWRFPARNRLVAALAAAVVVVESAESGGSMYTVDEALARDRPVFAVPGSIRSPVSAGTNRLISQGAHVLCSIDELVESIAPPATVPTRSVSAPPAPSSWLLELLGWEPVALDSVAAESGRALPEITLEAERLIGLGLIRRRGAVVERVR